jgi:cytochrome c556
MRYVKSKFLFVFSVSALCIGTLALAHTGVKNMTVMARMQSMSALGDSVKVLGEMVKGNQAFDAAEARAAAEAIARHARETPALFEAPETDPKSEALPVIWEDFTSFVAKSEALEAVAADLAVSMQAEADLRSGLARIGTACKACHEVYRK